MLEKMGVGFDCALSALGGGAGGGAAEPEKRVSHIQVLSRPNVV
jgi:hypothetical protein